MSGPRAQSPVVVATLTPIPMNTTFSASYSTEEHQGHVAPPRSPAASCEGDEAEQGHRQIDVKQHGAVIFMHPPCWWRVSMPALPAAAGTGDPANAATTDDLLTTYCSGSYLDPAIADRETGYRIESFQKPPITLAGDRSRRRLIALEAGVSLVLPRAGCRRVIWTHRADQRVWWPARRDAAAAPTPADVL